MNETSFSSKSRLWIEGELICLTTPYDKQFVKECREVPGRTWNNKLNMNTFPPTSVTYVMELCRRWNVFIPHDVSSLPPSETDTHNVKSVTKDGNTLIIRFLYSPEILNDLKTNIPQARWNPSEKVWTVSVEFADVVIALAKDWDFYVEPGVSEEIDRIVDEREKMFDASNSLSADIHIPHCHESVLPYQKAGIDYMLKARRAILGDQPGLGKTLQALTAIVADNCFPAIVVCPNTLKLNWVNEVKKFYPYLTVNVVSGKKRETLPDADITVINYDILYERVPDLLNLYPVALVADESHAIKNGRAYHVCSNCEAKVRSNARNCSNCKERDITPMRKWNVKRAGGVIELSENIPRNGLVLLLTGTPITNRPIELVPQLEAIDAIQHFGGRWKFEARYCPSGSGAAFMSELNKKLRSLCYIRRKKQDVYGELPDVRNAVQILNIPSSLYKEYYKIEQDVIEVLAQRAREAAEELGEDPGMAYWEKIIQLQFSEHLVRLTVLRDAVAKMKYQAITEWLDQFLDNGDEKVVVFAEHIDLVEKIAEKYGDLAVKVRGGVSNSDRMKAVDRFQNDPTCRIFVANMKAASEGLTLTAASDVVFCELAWTPSMHEQCVGRCYGRVNDMHGATAWYLLAEDTIDDDIFDILESKKLIVDAVTNGIDPEAEHGVMIQLLWRLTERGLRGEKRRIHGS